MKLVKVNTKISVISNIVLDPFFSFSVRSLFGGNTRIIVTQLEDCNGESVQKLFENSDIIIVWLNFEYELPNTWNLLYSNTISEQDLINRIISRCNQLYSNIQGFKKSQILWFLFEDYYYKFSDIVGNSCNSVIDRINDLLKHILKNNVTYVDLKRLIAKIGINQAYDQKNKYRWNSPYSSELIHLAVKEIYKCYAIHRGITKKCLVLDCDNVLWGGILSEDGIENIRLGTSGIGREFLDFQRFVLSLYYHGVIIAICSKNDLPDVLTVFREHSDMLLKEDHIACFQVNWDNKPENIKLISDILNIGLDSIVFVDDSPVEVEAVKSILPDVTALLYERDLIYEKLACFHLKNDIDITTIEKRNHTYQTVMARNALKTKYESYDDFIEALEIKIDIHKAVLSEYTRISELTQRANRCTNGKRYTVSEISDRVLLMGNIMYSVTASDRFSDLGLIGVIEVECNTLTLFCLSCRVLGRRMEDRMIQFIKSNHSVKNINLYLTGKNQDTILFLNKEFKLTGGGNIEA